MISLKLVVCLFGLDVLSGHFVSSQFGRFAGALPITEHSLIHGVIGASIDVQSGASLILLCHHIFLGYDKLFQCYLGELLSGLQDVLMEVFCNTVDDFHVGDLRVICF